MVLQIPGLALHPECRIAPSDSTFSAAPSPSPVCNHRCQLLYGERWGVGGGAEEEEGGGGGDRGGGGGNVRPSNCALELTPRGVSSDSV